MPDERNTLEILDELRLISDRIEADLLIDELEQRFTRMAYRTGMAVDALRVARRDAMSLRLQLAHDREMQE